MKNLFFKLHLSLLLISVASFSFAQNSNDFKFEKTIQKFKKVDEGQIVELKFAFTYSGDREIKFLEPEVDCTCTEVFLTSIIKPNTTSFVIVKFDTKGKIGWQEREIIIPFITDDESSSFTKKITFKGNVKASKATKKAYKET